MTQAERSGTTTWSWSADIPLRRFLRTESGSAALLLGATILALLWANLATASYESFWHTEVGLSWGESALELQRRRVDQLRPDDVLLLRRRARDPPRVRHRRAARAAARDPPCGRRAPSACSLTALIFVVVNRDSGAAHGWGVAMSTDTAFALGVLALVGPRFSERLRAFLLTVVIIDDVIALVVIATVYTEQVTVVPLVVAIALFGAVVVLLRLQRAPRRAVLRARGARLGRACRSGVDPVVIGLVLGLLDLRPSGAARAARAGDRHVPRLPRAAHPGPRTQRAGQRLRQAISPNERLQELYHPWTSYLIVPLFALANAGIVVKGDFLATAFRSPITWGVILGYVVGKPVGIVGGAWLVTRLSSGRLRPSVGWARGARRRHGVGHRLHR